MPTRRADFITTQFYLFADRWKGSKSCETIGLRGITILREVERASQINLTAILGFNREKQLVTNSALQKQQASKR